MASARLSRTPSSAGNRKKWTWSAWIKRGSLTNSSNGHTLWNCEGSSNTDNFIFQIDGGSGSSGATDSLALHTYGNDAFTTAPLLKDVAGWYHIVFALDTAQATATDRIKLYVNGTQISYTQQANFPAQNQDMGINRAALHCIGSHGTNANYYFDGYMTHVHFTDGYAYAASDFGQTDATTGIWKPKTSPSVTYGTNGYFLKMDNSANMGLDSSGQTNNFTTSGTIIQSKCTPSNLYCTLNPNDVMKQSGGVFLPTYSNLNNTISAAGNNNYQAFGTLSPDSGKWYWEMKVDTANTTGHRLGVFFGNHKQHGGSYYYGTNAFYIHQNGQIYYNGSSTTYMASYTAGDIISVAMDVTNGNIYFSKNGGSGDSTWADGSGNNNQAFPGTSVNGKLSVSWKSGPATPFFDVYGTGNKISINWGEGFFGTTAVSSAGSNGNGSTFEYNVPTGYYALNTENLGAQS